MRNVSGCKLLEGVNYQNVNCQRMKHVRKCELSEDVNNQQCELSVYVNFQYMKTVRRCGWSNIQDERMTR